MKLYHFLLFPQDLEKHITHLNKNHRHELGIEMARNRETHKQLEQVREEKDKIQQQMRVSTMYNVHMSHSSKKKNSLKIRV